MEKTYHIFNTTTGEWKRNLSPIKLRKLLEHKISFVGVSPDDFFITVDLFENYTRIVKQKRDLRVFDNEDHALYPEDLVNLFATLPTSKVSSYNWKDSYYTGKYIYRQTPVPYVGKRGRGFYGRSAKHTYKSLLTEPLIRNKYKQSIKERLVDWDYDHYCNEKNWKSQRKTQYKDN